MSMRSSDFRSFSKMCFLFRGGFVADGGGVLWNLLLGVRGFTEALLSQACGLPAQHKARPTGALKGKRVSPLGEGNRRRRWRGSLWNLLIGVKGLCNNPSVSLRLPAPFSREPKVKASLEKGGEPPLGGGGIFCEIFYMMFQITPKNRRDYPTSAFRSTLQRGAALC